MAKSNALIIAAVIGAVLGTVLRPGVPEILIVALVLVVCRVVYGRATIRRRRVVLCRATMKERVPGALRGEIRIADDFDDSVHLQ